MSMNREWDFYLRDEISMTGTEGWDFVYRTVKTQPE